MKFLLMSSILFSLSLSSAFASVADDMKLRAEAVLDSLSKEQQDRAHYSFESIQKKYWRYFPSTKAPSIFPEHTGLKFTELNEDQRSRVLDLVETAVSSKGMDHVEIVRLQEDDSAVKRKLQEKLFFHYGSENYFISFFGKPTDKEWMWRFEGHHISINITIQNGQITKASPFFLGINPTKYVFNGKDVVVHEGVVAGFAKLRDAFAPAQWKDATSSMKKLPKDLLFTPSLMGKLRIDEKLPNGLLYKNMTDAQQRAVFAVIEDYLSNLKAEGKSAIQSKVATSDLGNIEVVFAGDKTMKGEYYWRIQGPTFVFEFMTADGNKNHYHVAWQDLE